MSLARIARHYGVPARRGAPVLFEGKRGRVVGALNDDEHVLVRLAGEDEARPYHPTWHMVWLEENGRATRVPQVPVIVAPAWPVMDMSDEPQWSGV